MAAAADLQWIKPPQQARSQQTLERILETAEELVLEGKLDTTPVKQIARRAGSSVGAFYARFPDKEALFQCVFQRFYDEAVATVNHALEPERWEDVTIDDIVHNAVSFLLTIFRQRRGMIAAFALRAAKDPELGNHGQQLAFLVVERMAQLFEHKNIHIAHPRPREALGMLVWLLLSALEARALHHFEDTAELSHEEVTAEITRMCLAYLGTAPKQ
jgi:AcrR family transcriptional regulator